MTANMLVAFFLLLFWPFCFSLSHTSTCNLFSTTTNETGPCYPPLGCFPPNGPMSHLQPYQPLSLQKMNVKFYLWTANSPNEMISIDPFNKSTLTSVNIPASKRIVILIHGFNEDSEDEVIQQTRITLLKESKNQVGAVILVDWRNGSSPWNWLPRIFGWLEWICKIEKQIRNKFFIPYKKAAVNTQLVGRLVTYLVEQLRVHHRINPAKHVQLIGFSLGAQVAGFAGKWSKMKSFGWKYARITGLDAAGPFFEGYPGSHLTADDALFVDAIHTSIRTRYECPGYGFSSPYGHVDFYAHNGTLQPECSNLFPYSFCSHKASLVYYEASIRASCSLSGCQMPTPPCTNLSAIMGHWTDRQTPLPSGKLYTFPTSVDPYCE